MCRVDLLKSVKRRMPRRSARAEWGVPTEVGEAVACVPHVFDMRDLPLRTDVASS